MNPLATLNIQSWEAIITAAEQQQAIQALEQGKIVYLPHLKFHLNENEKKFLSPAVADKKSKNIHFDIKTGKLGGIACKPEEITELKDMVTRFASQTERLVHQLFPPYKAHLEIARTSFRPVEIVGRVSSYRKDDTRLHVDAFPATPNQGRRILRVFSNVNPEGKPRIWRVGEPFEMVASSFFPKLPAPFPGVASLLKLFKLTRSYRTAYDHFMLHMHNQMKADLNYQKKASQMEIHFPAHTTWIVYTDVVSHAAMGGQHLFEQTFHLPVHGMQNPELSPLRILETVAARPLI